MKTIIKRGTSFLVAILLICMLNCIVVFAEQLPTYYISEKTESDNTLSVTISFTENVAAAGTIKLTYNQDKLTLMSALKGSSKAQMITINDKEKGVVSVNFLNAEDVIKDDTKIAVLTFSIDSNKISANDIIAESFKLYDLDSQLLSDNMTVEAVYNVDTEDIPADISFVSENVEESDEDTSSVQTISDEQNSKQSSAENSKGNNGNTTESSSQAYDSSESKSAEITDESDYKETSDEITESEGSSTIESIDESDIGSLNGSNESTASNNQNNDNPRTENPVPVIVIICIVVFLAAAAAAFIIRKQKSKKETGGHENER